MTLRARLLAPWLGIVAALAALIGFAAFDSTGASEYLIQEEPERGSTIAEAPHQLVLTFDRPLAQLKNAHHVEVTDANGTRLDDGHNDISTYSQRTLIVPLHGGDEGDGGLTVDYRVLLVGDGELLQVRSSYEFTVDHSLESGSGEAVEAPATTRTSQSMVLWTVAILLGIAAAGAMLYFLRMATGNARSSLEPTNRTIFRN